MVETLLDLVENNKVIEFYPIDDHSTFILEHPWAVVKPGSNLDKITAAFSEYFRHHPSIAFRKQSENNYTLIGEGVALPSGFQLPGILSREEVVQLLIVNPRFGIVNKTSFVEPSEPTPPRRPPAKQPPKGPAPAAKKPSRPRWSPTPKCPLHKEHKCYTTNKICNPASGYCVFRDKAIGRGVLGSPGYVQYDPNHFGENPQTPPPGPPSGGRIKLPRRPPPEAPAKWQDKVSRAIQEGSETGFMADYEFGDLGDEVRTAPWFIISKPGCPSCKKAEDYLTERGVVFGSLAIDAGQLQKKSKNSDLPLEVELRDLLQLPGPGIVGKLFGQKTPLPTYPMIFKCPLADQKIRPKYSGGVTMRCKGQPVYIGGYAELKREPELQGLPTTSALHMIHRRPALTASSRHIGNQWATVIALLYLNHRFKNNCTPIPASVLDYFQKVRPIAAREPNKVNPFNANAGFLAKLNLQSLSWEEISLQWYEPDFLAGKPPLLIPPGFWTAVKDCLARVPKNGFLTMPLDFVCAGPESMHANLLIFDTATGELERFEPNGFLRGACFNPPGINKILQDAFNKNVYKGMVKRVLSPLHFCPVGFQKIQAFEQGERGFYKHGGPGKQGGVDVEKPNEPGGWCAAWVIWYAELRLMNPNKTREQVISMAHNKLKSDEKSFFGIHSQIRRLHGGCRRGNQER